MSLRHIRFSIKLIFQNRDFNFAIYSTPSKFNTGTNAWKNFTKKCNGRNEMFEKKIHVKEVSHDRAIPLSG